MTPAAAALSTAAVTVAARTRAWPRSRSATARRTSRPGRGGGGPRGPRAADRDSGRAGEARKGVPPEAGAPPGLGSRPGPAGLPGPWWRLDPPGPARHPAAPAAAGGTGDGGPSAGRRWMSLASWPEHRKPAWRPGLPSSVLPMNGPAPLVSGPKPRCPAAARPVRCGDMRALPVPDPGTPDLRSPARYITWLISRQKGPVGLGVLWGCVWMVAQALAPAAIGAAIDGLVARQTWPFTQACLLVLALGLIAAGSGLLRHRCVVGMFLDAAYRTVQLITGQAARLGHTLARLVTTGEVVSVGTADVQAIGNTIDVSRPGQRRDRGADHRRRGPAGHLAHAGPDRADRRAAADRDDQPGAPPAAPAAAPLPGPAGRAGRPGRGHRVRAAGAARHRRRGRVRRPLPRPVAGPAVDRGARGQDRDLPVRGRDPGARRVRHRGHLDRRALRAARPDHPRRARHVLRLRVVPDPAAGHADRGRRQGHPGPGRGRAGGQVPVAAARRERPGPARGQPAAGRRPARPGVRADRPGRRAGRRGPGRPGRRAPIWPAGSAGTAPRPTAPRPPSWAGHRCAACR